MLPKLTWFGTVGCFSIFTLVSFYKAVSGEGSCGCFGAVEVNPWFTSVFDLSIVCVLFFVRPKPIFNFAESIENILRRKRFITILLLWTMITVPVLWFSMSTETIILVESHELIDDSKNITLIPSRWINQKFPLLPFLNETAVRQIETGNKNVVLFRFDCEECQKMVENIQNKKDFLFVAVPAEKNNAALFVLSEYVSLPDNREWWVETPVVLTLKNTVVQKVARYVP
jgi:hypothetical protein